MKFGIERDHTYTCSQILYYTLFLCQRLKRRWRSESSMLRDTNLMFLERWKLINKLYLLLLTCSWKLLIIARSIQNAKIQRTHKKTLCITNYTFQSCYTAVGETKLSTSISSANTQPSHALLTDRCNTSLAKDSLTSRTSKSTERFTIY
jgi:hypothetical protein